MLNPPDKSQFEWIGKQPDKRLAILGVFEHEDMGRSAIKVAQSPAISESMRIAAIRYLRKVQYREGYDDIFKIASSTEEGALKRESLVTSAVLKPADTHLVAKIDQLVNEANPKAEAIRTAAEITLEIWGHVYTSEDAAERLKTGTKLLKFALNHGAFLPETRAHSRGLRRAEYSSGIQGVMVVLFF